MEQQDLAQPKKNLSLDSMLIAALFTGAKIWKQPQCPSTGERIKKIWYALNIYSGIKFITVERHAAVCDNMVGP